MGPCFLMGNEKRDGWQDDVKTNMFSTLRFRLFISYAGMIVLLLGIVGCALVLYLIRNPAVDRQAYASLSLVAERLARRMDEERYSAQLLPDWRPMLGELGENRVLVLSEERQVVFDSQPGAASLHPKLRWTTQLQRGLAIDADKQAWYYVWHPLNKGGIVVVARTRLGPVSILFSQRLRDVFRDELIPPFAKIGAIALVLALILAFWISDWVTRPMRDLDTAAAAVARGEYSPVPVSGPSEARRLASTFNQMMDKVKASQDSQRNFIANVSHELKTPLTSIQGFAQALQDGTADTDEARAAAAGVIFGEAARMHRLVMDLLDLARWEGGTYPMEQNIVQMEAVIKSVLEKMKPQAEAAQLHLTYQAEGVVPSLFGDGDQLEQVFTNLVDNAIRFTPPGGEVGLTSWYEDGAVLVSVRDTGVGMENVEIPRIFERFYQVERSRPGGGVRGTGLGLPIAQEIVHAHGGSIAVESQPGQGSNFVVKIPIANHAGQGAFDQKT